MSVAVAVEALRGRLVELAAEEDRIESALLTLNGHVGAPLFPETEPVAVKEKKERKPRTTGIGVVVADYMKDGKEYKSADVATALGLESMQVAQVLTAGKKKGKFVSVGRGVWKVA